MKIVIYYPWIYLKSGVERTILESVKGSKNSYTIFTNHFDKKATYPEFKKLDIRKLKYIPVRRNILSTLKAAITIAFQKVDLKEFNLLIIHSEGLGDLFLLRNKAIPTICFCHTPLRPVFDPEYKKRARAKRNRLTKLIYSFFDFSFKNVDRFLWKKYDYIIFNSRETLNRAKRGDLLGKGIKYKVLHPGVHWQNTKPTWIYKKYFLVPGRIMWTKNIELAIESFKIFNKTNRDFKLIIAGQVDKKSEPYLAKLKTISKNYSNISFIKNPTDKQMNKLYSDCYAAIFTAFNEDWGITPIEANAFGKPAIVVKKGGFKESQIHQKTGCLVAPNAEKIAACMNNMARNPKRTKRMGTFARKYSMKFSWNNFNKKLESVTEKFSPGKSA